MARSHISLDYTSFHMEEDRRSIHSRALPGYEKAVIPDAKLEKYALDPTHDEGKHKARVFKSALSFDQSNWQELKRKILEGLPFYEAVPSGEGPYGLKYVVTLRIEGPNSNIAEVETVWIIRPNTDYPSLVTALVAKRR